MEPVEAVSSDGTAIEGYLVRPGRPEALSPRQSRVRDTLKLLSLIHIYSGCKIKRQMRRRGGAPLFL